jgi:hypothetical protein
MVELRSLDHQERPASLVIPADTFPHGRNQHLVAAVLRRKLEVERYGHRFARRYVAARVHTRPVHDQRAGVAIEQVIAHREPFVGPPSLLRLVAHQCFDMRGRGLRDFVGRVHEYSQSG